MHKKEHHIKCETAEYQSIERGELRFNIRKNDRDYKEGDIVHFKECVRAVETGRVIGPLTIDYIVHGPQIGIMDGFCVFNWEGE